MTNEDLKTNGRKPDGSRDEYNIDFYHRVREAHGFRTTWSIPEVTDFTVMPFGGGTVTLRYAAHSGWGTPGEVRLTDALLLDLWRAADKLIVDSGDLHHVFIEAFDPVENTSGEPGTVLDIVTGS